MGGKELIIFLDLDVETESIIHNLTIGFKPKLKKVESSSTIEPVKSSSKLSANKLNESSKNAISNEKI